MKRRGLLGAAVALLAAGCGQGGKGDGRPPPSREPLPQPALASQINVPIDADTAALTRELERAIPRTLWTIDQRLDRCVAAQRVRLFGRAVKVSPDLGCRVVGQVDRGPIRLAGAGRDIVADIPLNARISARDVGGTGAGQTATGTALAHARIRLDIAPDFTPRGTVRLTYDWREPPGIDLLGNRITFTDQADAKLRPIARRLERTLPRELARLDVRGAAERLWRQGFTTVSLNAAHPPVWMRITPRALRYDTYQVQAGRLRLNMAMEAVTETFVGARPADPRPTPLPMLQRGRPASDLRFFLPIVADYAELEPVVMRALRRRSARPFAVPGVGAVRARFERIKIYGAQDGRIAVGLLLSATPPGDTATRGIVWLSARPRNTPGSAMVAFDDLAIAGDADRMSGDLVLTLAETGSFNSLIADALTQNFQRDLAALVGRVRRALVRRPLGDFVIDADITRLESGRICAYGPGLYLPLRVSGAARISYRPR